MTPWITKPIPFNIGQAFGETVPPEQTCYTLDSIARIGIGGNANHITRLGVEVETGHDMIGKNVSQMTFYIGNEHGSSLTGDMVLKIYDSSGTLQATSDETYDASGLPTTPYTAVYTISHTFVDGDRAVIQGCTACTSGANEVFVQGNSNTTQFSNQFYVKFRDDTGWANVGTNTNCQFCFTA